MNVKEFAEKLEKCEIGFLYDKKQLFKYLLSDVIRDNEYRIGIVVSVEIIQTNEGFIPVLNFKRLKLERTTQNVVSLDLLSHKERINCQYYNLVAGKIIPANEIALDASSKIIINSNKDRGPKDENFHKCLFMINQLKIIKEYSASQILFSAAYVNYVKSAWHNNIDDGLWFTFKVEGLYTPNTSYKLEVETNTSLPTIELGSPCPPIWHDGSNPD